MNPKSELKTVLHFIERARFEFGMTKKGYAALVIEHFQQTVPEQDCRLSVKTGRGKGKLDFHVVLPADGVDEVDWKLGENSKKLWKYIDGGAGHMPVLLRRSLVAGLPELLRIECWRALHRGDGFVCFSVPETVEIGLSEFGRVHKETADFMAAMAGPLSDHRIDVRDSLDDLLAIYKEAMDVVETYGGIAERVKSLISIKRGAGRCL